MITVERLVAAGVAPTQARMFAEPLKAACALFAIDTPARIACFVGQLRVESTDFTRLEENLRYTTPQALRNAYGSRVLPHINRLLKNPKGLANFAYANRIGNGDEESGDGWLFRGRGLKMLTGRANYTRAQIDLNRPYVSDPDLVAQPSDAALTAAHFWSINDLSRYADAWNIETITERVNGRAKLALDLRRQYSEMALEAFA